MRISGLLLLGAAASLAGVATPAFAGGAGGKGWSGGHMPRPGMHMPRPGMHMPPRGGTWHGGGWNGGGHRWGQRYNGRWYAGWRAPGGWGAYRRPAYGYVLPSYWISPNYYIGNYGAYGLPAPGYGYGWSRYYDDAVMTDRYGRVYDSRSDVDWGRYEGGYDDRDYDYDAPRRDNGVGGAAIGAVVGGIAGNRIAGRGNRTAGTLIGAGVGAVAGMAIDKAEDSRTEGDWRRDAPPPRRPGAAYDYGYGYADDSVTTQNDYEGRWTGTWTTDDGRKVSGTYDGKFEGQVRGAGVDYDAPPYAGGPHWSHGAAPAVPAGGYISGGYYYPAPVVTTVTVQPAVTTTTTTTYVTETVGYRKPVRRRARSCRCK
ncbi:MULTISPECIES: RcnB family protein [unclassified Sphingobium]|uniref:RcnB family protein n=1 Tax=unclassified Sphingobium TaxID=2611147 RepID=UPI0035A5FEF4